MLVTKVNSFRSYHAALPLASILQTTIQHMACLTDYLTDRQLPLCKMAVRVRLRGAPFWSSYLQNKEEYPFVKEVLPLVTVKTHKLIN